MPDPVDKRLEWLDEERRRMSDALKVIGQRLAALEESHSKTTHKVQEQAAETSRLGALASRISQFDDTLTKHRQEVSRQLDTAEDRRTEKEKVVEDLRKSDLRELSQAIAGVKKELGVVDELRRHQDDRREEEIKLTRSVDAFAKRLDDFASRDEDRGRTLASLEEGRKQDSKRIAELQAETGGMRSRLDTARGTLDTVEDRLRRIEVRVAELVAGESERREILSLWMDQQNMRQVEFDRTWKEWARRFEAFEKQASDLDERVKVYDETYRALRQQREDLDAMIQRLERRITEVSEMQRLAEDRFKQDWAAFQAEDQKRWNTYRLAREELWREHNRLHEKISSELSQLDESVGEALRLLNAMSATSASGLSAIISILSEWSGELGRES